MDHLRRVHLGPIGRLAELGIIAGPGVFYGEDGEGSCASP